MNTKKGFFFLLFFFPRYILWNVIYMLGYIFTSRCCFYCSAQGQGLLLPAVLQQGCSSLLVSSCFTRCLQALAGRRRPSGQSGFWLRLWVGRSSSTRRTSCTFESSKCCSDSPRTSPERDTHHWGFAASGEIREESKCALSCLPIPPKAQQDSAAPVPHPLFGTKQLPMIARGISIFQRWEVVERTQTASELQQLPIEFQDTVKTHRAVEASFPIHGQVATRGLPADDHHADAHCLDPQDVCRPNKTGNTQLGLVSPPLQPQQWSILVSGFG